MTEQSMVELVARAILADAMPLVGGWDVVSDDDRKRLLSRARVAIAAMREPTRAMQDAANRLSDFCAVHNYGGSPPTDDVWSTMIDAALAEP